MSIAAILVVGVLAGIISSVLMGGIGFGIIGDLLVGLVGSFVGGFFIGNLLHITTSTIADVMITATVGAIVFLIAFGMFPSPHLRKRLALKPPRRFENGATH